MLKPWLLSDVATDLNARVIGGDVAFSAVGTDSRTIAAGQLFVALTGPRFDGQDYLADVAVKLNSTVENIGARRLQTVMERVLDEISFVAPDKSGEKLTIDAEYVRKHVGDLAANTDLSRYIL